MRKSVLGFWWTPTTEGTPALVVTAVFFALGGLLGVFTALRTADGGVEAMASYLDRFLAAAQSGALDVPALPELLWRAVRWPLAAVLFGFSALGLLGIPVLVSLRGFFLAFSIASFARAYGRGGLTVAFFLLGVPGTVAVPAFFLMAVQSFSTALALAGRVGGGGRRELPFHRDHFFRCGVCAAAVFVSLLLERYLVPVLVAGAAGALLH